MSKKILKPEVSFTGKEGREVYEISKADSKRIAEWKNTALRTAAEAMAAYFVSYPAESERFRKEETADEG